MELFIGGLLLSFPLALIGVILLFTVLYSESRMAARIGKRFGFQVSGKRLSKPGWQLGFHHQTEGRKTRYLMRYEVQEISAGATRGILRALVQARLGK